MRNVEHPSSGSTFCYGLPPIAIHTTIRFFRRDGTSRSKEMNLFLMKMKMKFGDETDSHLTFVDYHIEMSLQHMSIVLKLIFFDMVPKRFVAQTPDTPDYEKGYGFFVVGLFKNTIVM